MPAGGHLIAEKSPINFGKSKRKFLKPFSSLLLLVFLGDLL
jgi:hypothetical protein